MRWTGLILLFVCAFAVVAHAESARVIKVLPLFLDQDGRTSKNPSLFDRDAYQAELRDTSSKRSGLRFNVQWKANFYDHDHLTVHIEAKGMKGKNPTKLVLAQPVHGGSWSKWTELTLTGDTYKDFGELISWRATLRSGTNVVAEQKSFLW
jgi:hypothetical protein